VAQLVAIDMAPSASFVDTLQRTWEAGDAVFPVDQRLPPTTKKALLDAIGPTRVVDSQGATSWPGLEVESGDALVVATSGTTGLPQGAILTHAAVQASARITSSWLDVASTDHWLCCLPVAHIGGLSVITRALWAGTPLTVLPTADPQGIDVAAAKGATLVSLVVAALDRVQPEQFRSILLGGSAIPVHRPANTVATYGMTETGSGIVYDGFALDEVGLRIVDGEIQVKTPSALRCYRDGTNPFTSDGWLPTGDGGSLAPDGRLTVTGRLAEVINSGGEKVWPAEVERVLGAKGHTRLAIVGRPDPDWGEVVTIVSEADAPLSGLSLEEIRDLLRDSLPGYALPRRLDLVTELPRTAMGKVIRSRL
jgi:O-succinylbenzoic acid--CoA ligase